MINRIFERNVSSKDYPLVIGLALDSLRIDIIEETIKRTNASEKIKLLNSTVAKLWDLDVNTEFYFNVLNVVVKLLIDLEESDYFTACQVLII